MDLRTDLEKLTALFKQFGLGYDQYELDDLLYVDLRANEHEKVEGYIGFASSYVFDKENEHFIRVKVFE